MIIIPIPIYVGDGELVLTHTETIIFGVLMILIVVGIIIVAVESLR